MKKTQNSYSDVDHLALVARRIAESGADLTSDYKSWMDVTFACASLGEQARESYHLICSQYAGYKREESTCASASLRWPSNGSRKFRPCR